MIKVSQAKTRTLWGISAVSPQWLQTHGDLKMNSGWPQMCFSGHIVIGGLYVRSMKINVFCIEGSVRKYNHLCKKWKRFPERKVLTRSVCSRVGRLWQAAAAAGKPLQCSARLHRAFHCHWDKRGPETVLWWTDGIFWSLFFFSCHHKRSQSDTNQLLKLRIELVTPYEPKCAPGISAFGPASALLHTR